MGVVAVICIGEVDLRAIFLVGEGDLRGTRTGVFSSGFGEEVGGFFRFAISEKRREGGGGEPQILWSCLEDLEVSREAEVVDLVVFGSVRAAHGLAWLQPVVGGVSDWVDFRELLRLDLGGDSVGAEREAPPSTPTDAGVEAESELALFVQVIRLVEGPAGSAEIGLSSAFSEVFGVVPLLVGAGGEEGLDIGRGWFGSDFRCTKTGGGLSGFSFDEAVASGMGWVFLQARLIWPNSPQVKQRTDSVERKTW